LKGIAEIFMMFVVTGLIGTFLFVELVIPSSSVMKRANKEIFVIKALNDIEFAKRELPKSLKYSFYQSHFILSQGGHSDLTGVDSDNCIPYWKIYDITNLPSYKNSFEQSALGFLNEYAIRLETDVSIPYYSNIIINENPSGLEMFTEALNDFELNREKPNIKINLKDKPGIHIKIEQSPFELFKIGEKYLDRIEIQIKYEIRYSDLQLNLLQLQSLIQQELDNDYGAGKFIIQLTPENNYGVDNYNFAVRVLVKITDLENKIPVYDYDSGLAELKNLELNFYIFSGNYIADPAKSVCTAKISPSPTIPAGDLRLEWPTPGGNRISSCYLARQELDFDGDGIIDEDKGDEIRIHKGIDIAVPVKTNVIAPADGEVIKVFIDSLGGNALKIKHTANGEEYTTIYYHLDEQKVSEGQHVNKGDLVALSGDTGKVTGPHLHFELRDGSYSLLNPCEYFEDTTPCDMYC